VIFVREIQYLWLQVLAMVDEPGHCPIRRFGHMYPVPAHVLGRLCARRRPFHAAHPRPVEVVIAAAGAAARLPRARRVETERGGVVDELEEGVVVVGVGDGRVGVRRPQAGDGALEPRVVLGGEEVHLPEAAHGVVVIRRAGLHGQVARHAADGEVARDDDSVRAHVQYLLQFGIIASFSFHGSARLVRSGSSMSQTSPYLGSVHDCSNNPWDQFLHLVYAPVAEEGVVVVVAANLPDQNQRILKPPAYLCNHAQYTDFFSFSAFEHSG
jgi:hypothetical protein